MTDHGSRELDRAPDPGSVVPCPRKSGARIGVGRCVEWQREEGCHCEHALVSLRATEGHIRGREINQHFKDAAEQEQERDAELAEIHSMIERAEAIERARPRLAVVSPAPQARAAPPSTPKEIQMPRLNPLDEVKDADFIAAYEKNGGSIDKVRQHFKVSSWLSVKKRASKLGLSGKQQGKRNPVVGEGIPSGSLRTTEAARSAPELAPADFPGLPKIDSLPPSYLIACARQLYVLRKEIEFALAGEKAPAA